ncbi:MAG: ribosome recycling factor [Patescibacteria group bacterium]
MAYNFSNFQKKIKETEAWLTREFSAIRTGRASTAFLDGVKVESYGAEMPISSVASISAEDAKTIRIAPWDSSQTQAIEKGIVAANLGVSVVVDGAGLRVIFPELTGERRQQLIKVAKEKLEDARVAIRRERSEVADDLNEKKKSGEMGEDEMMRNKTEMEKIVQEGSKKLEELFNKKEQEISL